MSPIFDEEPFSRSKGKPHCVVRYQSASVPIYTYEVHGKTRYTIAFYIDGLRRRRMFADINEAKREAKLAAEKIQRGLQSDNDLRSAEREAFLVFSHWASVSIGDPRNQL